MTSLRAGQTSLKAGQTSLIRGQTSISSLRKGGGVQPIIGATKAGGSASISATFSGRTFSLQLKLRRPIKGRVRLHKYGLGASNGIRASIAPHATNAASFVTPSGGLATLQPFVFPVDAHPAGSSTGASGIPAIVSSDWMDFETIPRTDGGNGYLVLIRVREDATSAGNRIAMATSGATTANFETNGWYVAYSAAGDFTLTNTGASFTADSTSGPPIILEFETDQAGKTVAWVGDSTMEGRDVGNLRTHPGVRLAIDALNASGAHLDYFNQGWSGSSTFGSTGTSGDPATVSGYFGQMRALLGALQHQPDIVCFQASSVNNSNAYNVSEANYWAEQFVAWAQARGMQPVLVTPPPNDSNGAGAKAAATAIINKALALGVPYVDRMTPLENGSGAFADAADTSDGTHLTRAGAEKERDAAGHGWTAVLQALVA
ncbi:hypothetical protein ACO34A_13040 [Rhizobium sp. ACO-34A]|nr:SGNH/GDSL hydrolase family protein [Rhizobium sp. ACO-34A]ATN34726.1 hypothetical protein ACO34A_13040 [Rhizobium sp. ACO-34A]